MKRAAPWSIDGIKPDIREAAREAARRQGLTLSEWLNDIIAEHASDLDIDAEDMNSDDRLEAVAARLRQLGGQDDRQERHQEHHRRSRSASIQTDELEERRRMKRQDRFQDRHHERLDEPPRAALRLKDAEALLDAAVDAFDERAAESQRQTAQSVNAVTKLLKAHTRQRDESMEVLSDISSRLSEIETQMTRQAVDEACGQGARDNQFDALPAVARRLEDIESHLAKRSPDEAYKPIESVLSRLESQLDSMSQKAVPAGQDEDGFRRLEKKLDALLGSSALVSPGAEAGKPFAKTGWRESLDAAVAEIGHRQRILNGDAAEGRAVPRRAQGSLIRARLNKNAPASSADMSPLQKDIESLGVKLEAMRLQDLAKDLARMRAEMDAISAGLAGLAPRDSVNAIESALRNLTARIETSREEGTHETLLKPLTELADDLRHSLGGAGSQASINELERNIKAISEKIEAIGKARQEPSIFPSVLARLQEQMQDIHNQLAKTAVNPQSIREIERKIADLSGQIERQRSFPNPVLGPSEDDFTSSRSFQAHIESFSKIEDRLDDLSKKVERAIKAPTVSNTQLDPKSLESVVRILADRFAAAQNPQAGAAAIEALQGQIAELAHRLERSDKGFSALSTLQNSVSELFKHLEETRFTVNETAQVSAREAAREAVREVMEQSERLARVSPDKPDITSEIADLRLVQDEADRRTHSTLNAVHQTLEKIVDRLAMLEDEISEAQQTSIAGLRLAEQSSAFTRARDGSIVANPAVADPHEMQAPAQRGGAARLADDAARGRFASNASADFLIEPGTLFPKSKEAAAGRESVPVPGERKADVLPVEPVRSRADFIAAARRAAQAAQADPSPREAAARPRIPMAAEAKDETPHTSLVAQTRDFLFNHKRQLTLSIAALFLMAGAYAVVKTMNRSAGDMPSNPPNAAVHSMNDVRTEKKADSRTVSTSDMAPVQPPQPSQPQPDKAPPPPSSDTQAKPDTPSARSDLGPAANLPVMAMGSASQKAITGSDPIVTGSIIAPKTANVPAVDSPAAVLALREQAAAGNAAAQYDLATRYAEGKAMPRDFKLAAEWYEKASARGLVPATYRLGSLYEKGFGVTRDLVRAKALYQKAAEQGHSHAMHNLAVLMAEGSDGKPDYAAAAIWFRKAAEFGIRDSQYNLAILYARGLGVSQDLVQSYVWFSIAAAQGDEDAGKKREDVAAKLDAKSLVQAKAAVDAFHPREPDRAANEVQLPPGGWEAAAPMPVAPKSSSSSKAKISRL